MSAMGEMHEPQPAEPSTRVKAAMTALTFATLGISLAIVNLFAL